MTTEDIQVEATPRIGKKAYGAEVSRLQAELVKVQQWVKESGARVVVLFEGRDAAGKGGTIKTITQYLSPRIARIVALPDPDRTGAHPVVLPALYRAPARRRGDGAVRPLLVQPRRGGEGHGVLQPGRAPAVHATGPDLRAPAGRGRHPVAQVLVLGQRRRAAAPLPLPARRPDAAVEAVADGPGVDHPLGGLLPGQGRADGAHRHPRGALVRGGERHQATRPAQHDGASVVDHPLHRGARPM